MATLEDFLAQFNLVLEDASTNLQGPLNAERVMTLQANESLPDNNKKLWELISQTVNMADQIVQLLQPPAIRLAETYLGMSRMKPSRHYFHQISIKVLTHSCH